MDYVSIREEALIEASRLQRQGWEEYVHRLEGPKTLAAGQRIMIEGVEHVLQTARNWAKQRGYDPDRAMAAFRRHPEHLELVWAVRLPDDRGEQSWREAEWSFGGPIPPAGDLSVPLPECLWVGDRFEVEDLSGLVYLSDRGPRLIAKG